MLLLLSLLVLLSPDQTEASGSYTAAVVEYANAWSPFKPADDVMVENAEEFMELMFAASKNQADIIVFPEGGLRGHGNAIEDITLPSPAERVAPCDHNSSYHPALVMLSCAARSYGMYTVINLSEKYLNKTTNSTELYNSNVVLDRTGTVVGRYRKFNPYGEPVNKPAVPDHHTFTTDFGVTFGTFICFDIEFLEPAIVLARQYGVRHFVFPHCWISELPFLTALQAQWGWAYSLDVVLLAAGCNRPLAGGTGSGIYHGRQGALTYFQTNSQTSRLLIAKVPINSTSEDKINESTGSVYNTASRENPSQQDPSIGGCDYDLDAGQSNISLTVLRDYMDVYATQLLPPTDDSVGSRDDNSTVSFHEVVETTLCQNNFCCEFEVVIHTIFSPTPPRQTNRGDDFAQYPYRLVAFDGVRWYGGGLATGGVQVCGVVPCVNESITSCGMRADDPSATPQVYKHKSLGLLYKTSTTFKAISIKANFRYYKTFIYPDIMVSGSGDGFGALVSSDTFNYNCSTVNSYNNSTQCSLRVNSPVTDLATAAIYARQFDRDGEKRTEVPRSYAHTQTHSFFAVCLLFLFIFRGILTNLF